MTLAHGMECLMDAATGYECGLNRHYQLPLLVLARQLLGLGKLTTMK
jgi:hypothetical protein